MYSVCVYVALRELWKRTFGEYYSRGYRYLYTRQILLACQRRLSRTRAEKARARLRYNTMYIYVRAGHGSSLSSTGCLESRFSTRKKRNIAAGICILRFIIARDDNKKKKARAILKYHQVRKLPRRDDTRLFDCISPVHGLLVFDRFLAPCGVIDGRLPLC